jgi:hypothetical protein
MLIRSPHSDDIHVRVLDTNKNNKAGQPLSLGSVLLDSWFYICKCSLRNFSKRYKSHTNRLATQIFRGT